MPDSHCPTKTLSAHGEIWPDQPDVPAVFHLGIRLSREPEIRKSRHAFYLGFAVIPRLVDWKLEAKAVGYITLRHFSMCVHGAA